jgi:hypothetical protein
MPGQALVVVAGGTSAGTRGLEAPRWDLYRNARLGTRASRQPHGLFKDSPPRTAPTSAPSFFRPAACPCVAILRAFAGIIPIQFQLPDKYLNSFVAQPEIEHLGGTAIFQSGGIKRFYLFFQ